MSTSIGRMTDVGSRVVYPTPAPPVPGTMPSSQDSGVSMAPQHHLPPVSAMPTATVGAATLPQHHPLPYDDRGLDRDRDRDHVFAPLRVPNPDSQQQQQQQQQQQRYYHDSTHHPHHYDPIRASAVSSVPYPSTAPASYSRDGHMDMDVNNRTAAAEADNGMSQLMILSRAAIAHVEAAANGNNRKRSADGELKDGQGNQKSTPSSLSSSPAKRPALAPLAPAPAPAPTSGQPLASDSARHHSRNPSGVSVASTAASRGLNQDGTKMATVLKYAMVKVKHGWQNKNMTQVEADLATRSPNRASSTSSPSSTDAPTSLLRSPAVLAPALPGAATMTTATTNPRRTPADMRDYAPPPLRTQVSSPSGLPAPHTPLQQQAPGAYPHHRGHAKQLSVADSMLFPKAGSQMHHHHHHHNSREQEAVQSLLFMSSPGNSAPLKRTAPTTSAFSPEPRSSLPRLAPLPPLAPMPSLAPPPFPTSFSQPAPTRQLLPDSAPRERKPLPTQKPSHRRHSLSASMAAPRRVGFPASPGSVVAMDVDSPAPKPPSARKRPVHGAYTTAQNAPHEPTRIITLPAALGAHHSTPRKKLSDEDIERMLDRAMAVDSDGDGDDDGLIEIPPRQRIKLPS